jgi:outer membrane receptor protein involved in Fe transport
MEFEGIIVNAGFRFDYFNANTYYPEDGLHPVPDSMISTGGVIHNPIKTKAKYQISPRIGVSHPITERDVLHFTYGHYFQTPPLYILYRNGNYDFSGAFPMVGNPNIEQEKTISYEIGVKHGLTDYALVDVTGFYKDISGLTDTEQIFYTAASYYTRYINIDYGNVRGIEISFMKRPEGLFSYWSGSAHYTYSVAKGKSSTTRQNYDYIWAGYVVPTSEHLLNWDQTHTVSVNVDFRVPSDQALFGIPHLNDFGINVITNYGSGLPWTPPSRTREQLINTDRRPSTFITNIKINKDFSFRNRVSISFLTYIYNVFDERNLEDIADTEWYKTFDDPEGRYEDESVWGEGRIIRVGAEINWDLGI